MRSINSYGGYAIFLFIFDIHMMLHFSLRHVSVDQLRFYCLRLQWSLPHPICLIDWLNSQSFYPKISWIDRESGWHMVACHQVFVIHHLPHLLSTQLIRGQQHMPFRLMGVASSSPSFCLPRYELHHVANQYIFALNYVFTTSLPLEHIQSAIKQMSHFIASPYPLNNNVLFHIQYLPNLYGWNQTLLQMLHQMRQTNIHKLVMARQKQLHFQHGVNVFDWLTYKPNCFHFVYIWQPHLALVALSPERLYFRHQHHLMTEAMAGTRPRSVTNRQDALWCFHLHENEKDVLEENWVKLDLEAKLNQLGTLFTSHHYSIFQTPYVQHLYVAFLVKLKANYLDTYLINSIHPTAAICGSPMPQAYLMLQKYESFHRGAYACPIGWIGDEDAHLCVSIRCALIRENQVVLFAGSGILAASLPHAEWNETENKFVY
uniref:isochorismate synthase n=2 Tax=Bangiophyceae TaxID=2797 RepID=A0A7G5VUG8_9RHOD|nr:menaquinone-specific isochorismate synthase [Cyanidiococcus yangmingshanensis]ABZ82024.1 MenF [Galdieria maxima]QMX77335.1 menaquinone-specific isochorismate synthase [Cyanidiococcus yangmingshanensis]UNJ15951.1 menaquinone-specific isochorismate synthase [Cyanidioschyzonaceae sp. 3]WDB00357.1 isochorismate synthase [Cyanidiococcus yangmingshanensis]